VDQIKSNFGILIYCSEHKTKAAEFFDAKNEKLVCLNCACASQQKLVRVECNQHELMQSGEMILKYSDQQEEYLNQLQMKLDSQKKLGALIVQEERGFDASEVFTAMKEAAAFFKKNKIEVNLLENNFLLTILRLHFLPESVIMNTNYEYKDLLQDWIDDKYRSNELLFRGTTDGFDSVTFHQKCDNKGPTVTLVLTT